MADYCLCAVCGGKAFYDADVRDSRYLGYDTWTGEYLSEQETVSFECLCVNCKKDYEIVVRKKQNG